MRIRILFFWRSPLHGPKPKNVDKALHLKYAVLAIEKSMELVENASDIMEKTAVILVQLVCMGRDVPSHVNVL